MTDLSKIRAIADIEKFGLKDSISMGESGAYVIPTDLWETQVLAPHGVSPEVFKKIENDSVRLATAVTMHTGTLAVEHFKANPDAQELGWNYQQGGMTQVSGIFNREAKDHTVLSWEVTAKTADMKRVLSHLGDEFANINS